MRIGLVRHFRVTLPFPKGWRNADELHAWRLSYDAAEVIASAGDLGEIAWQACIASDLPRAYTTARALFSGPIEQTPLLREPEFEHLGTGNLRLPVYVWMWVVRLCWITGHRSLRACRDDFRQRVRAAADRVSACEQDTLVVSHAAIMYYLTAELRRRGFTGPRFGLAEHAKVYVFEK